MPRRSKPKPRGGVRGPHASPGAIHAFPVSPTRWRAVFSLRIEGERRAQRYSVSAGSEADALALAAARRDQLAGVPVQQAAPVTLADYLARWLVDVVEAERSPRTFEVYLRNCRRLEDALGAIPLRDLDRDRIQAYFTQIRQTGALAPATIRLCYAVLQSALAHAVKTRVLPANPAQHVSLAPVRRDEVTVATPELLTAILAYAAAQQDRLTALWTLIATTGLRRGEALGLEWRDLDLERRRLHLRQQYVPQQGGPVFAPPKSRAGARVVDLLPQTVAALRTHRLAMGRERLAAGNGWPASDLVFLSRRGGPLNPRTADYAWKRLLAAGGFPPLHLHALRHTVGTLLTDNGESARTVQEILGHGAIQTTLATYTHVTARMRSGAIERLGDRLFGAIGAVDPNLGPAKGAERENHA